MDTKNLNEKTEPIEEALTTLLTSLFASGDFTVHKGTVYGHKTTRVKYGYNDVVSLLPEGEAAGRCAGIVLHKEFFPKVLDELLKICNAQVGKQQEQEKQARQTALRQEQIKTTKSVITYLQDRAKPILGDGYNLIYQNTGDEQIDTAATLIKLCTDIVKSGHVRIGTNEILTFLTRDAYVRDNDNNMLFSLMEKRETKEIILGGFPGKANGRFNTNMPGFCDGLRALYELAYTKHCAGLSTDWFMRGQAEGVYCDNCEEGVGCDLRSKCDMYAKVHIDYNIKKALQEK